MGTLGSTVNMIQFKTAKFIIRHLILQDKCLLKDRAGAKQILLQDKISKNIFSTKIFVN